jgi:putative redox protein
MPSIKLTFENSEGQPLAGMLDLPADRHPHSFALFAHCFTCTKNLGAVRNISRALGQQGIATLRFDFTGLGDSEGEFADTNFSSNVADLVQAARFLEEQYEAPKLLVGHSLGGAAVICAAGLLPQVEAVVTIGAPYSPDHVEHLIQSGKEEIESKGEATVYIGGRPFQVKKQFLEDIQGHSMDENLQKLDRALLILHSPQDRIVEIDNAARLYHAARHPKSFITLDGADHLLSRKEDSHYVGEIVGSWVKRYLPFPEEEKLRVKRTVAVRLDDEDYTTDVRIRNHSLTADEPSSVGGNDFGPTPYELLSASLGACTAMTLKMYAKRKGWDLKEVRVHLDHQKDHASDLSECEATERKIDFFHRLIELEGDLDEAQKKRLLEMADRCPVHRTLHNPVRVVTELAEAQA